MYLLQMGAHPKRPFGVCLRTWRSREVAESSQLPNNHLWVSIANLICIPACTLSRVPLRLLSRSVAICYIYCRWCCLGARKII